MNGNNIIIPPVTKIRNYFGEKVALYFSFLSFYTIMLIIPSIIAIPVYAIQVKYDKGENVTNVANVIKHVLNIENNYI